MELEYQWDLVEEEASDVFKQLRETVVTGLETLKDSVQGMLRLHSVIPKEFADGQGVCQFTQLTCRSLSPVLLRKE